MYSAVAASYDETDPIGVGPAHRSCNLRLGGRLGTRIKCLLIGQHKTVSSNQVLPAVLLRSDCGRANPTEKFFMPRA